MDHICGRSGQALVEELDGETIVMGVMIHFDSSRMYRTGEVQEVVVFS